MIGLAFLAVGLIWLAFSAYLSFKIPRWLGVKNIVGHLAIGLSFLTLLLIGPFVDEIVGMRQFEKLCAEAKSEIVVHDAIKSAKRVRANSPLYTSVLGHFIEIKKGNVKYIDLDTGQSVLEFEEYVTKGGRIWRATLLGGERWCQIENSKEFLSIWRENNLKDEINEGAKK